MPAGATDGLGLGLTLGHARVRPHAGNLTTRQRQQRGSDQGGASAGGKEGVVARQHVQGLSAGVPSS